MYLSVVLLLLLLQLPPATLSRILLMPFPYKSHVTEISAIGNELRTSGHGVYIVLPASYPDLNRIKVESKFTVLDYSVKERDFYSMSSSSSSESNSDWIDVALQSYPIDEFRANVDGFIQFCTNPLQDSTSVERLRRLQFDLAVVDAFPGSRCYWILAHWIGVPYVSLTTQYEPWLWRVPALPSFVPFPLAAGAYTERMTFSERLWNAWTLLDWTLWPRVEYIENSFVEKYLPGQTYWSLAAKSLVWLIDTDTLIDYPRPTMPNEVRTTELTARRLQPQLSHVLNDPKYAYFILLTCVGTTPIAAFLCFTGGHVHVNIP